ncbi:WYL domain-containing protein [Laribacter hongkongensis]|uniref:WYL domain-containing protein n=1 Tax=Laribacter hongkongensis TaxID=168471 RepID=UPI001EFEB9FF|nr:WYL domain-containing protein [Laribacter hongkongensis]MCG9000257.1 WYL domain-containing protein [Laribacter hongkongensis]MCG9006647.1 WYL domain-containing protein [Laribacter hongkongensis]MCG9015683.1 WYL domain-containing protein [Laribacter hongkongensis]
MPALNFGVLVAMDTVLDQPISAAQQDRLRYIELRLRFLGEIRRPDLCERFGVGQAAATRDVALYKSLAPANLRYDSRAKRYVFADTFRPLYETDPVRVLSWLSRQFGDISPDPTARQLPCVTPDSLALPDLGTLATITRAIHQHGVLAIEYHSISSGRTNREIVPFALVDNGLRWHVRAYDRKQAAFRDFVLTRIRQPRTLSGATVAAHELCEQDSQWNRQVELELVPHPDQPHPEITEMDYAMQGSVLKLRLRAATAGYALRRWSVDCSPDHGLRAPEFRLWLKDPLVLYGVQSARLAPGYRPPGEAA